MDDKIAWLKQQIAELEADAADVGDGEDPTTGLSPDDENRLMQYRFELREAEAGGE